MTWLLLIWLGMVTLQLGVLWGRFHRAEAMLHRRISAHSKLPSLTAHPRTAPEHRR